MCSTVQMQVSWSGHLHHSPPKSVKKGSSTLPGSLVASYSHGNSSQKCRLRPTTTLPWNQPLKGPETVSVGPGVPEEVEPLLPGNGEPESKVWSAFDKAYTVLRCTSALTNTCMAIVVLVYWVNLAGGVKNSTRLLSRGYFMTDYQTMLVSVSDYGYILPDTSNLDGTEEGSYTTNVMSQLSTTSIMSHGQPIMIEYSDMPNSILSPMISRCQGVSIPDLLTMLNNMVLGQDQVVLEYSIKDIAARTRACRAVDIPVTLVDVPHAYDTMTMFGVNNMMAIMYNTLFITAVLSISVLPHGSANTNWWVILAEILLVTNFISMLIFPFAHKEMHLPINNCILFLAIHVVVFVGILLVSMGPHKTPDKEEDGTEDDMRKTSDEDGVNSIFGASLVQIKTDVFYSNTRSRVHENLKKVKDSLARNLRPNSGVIHYNFVDNMISGMSMVNMRYFEYTLTAGLFLVGAIMTLYPRADAYVYQLLYQGMMLCNLVAIPLSRGIVCGCQIRQVVSNPVPINGKDQTESFERWLCTGLVMILISSFMFFLSALVPFGVASSPIMTSSSLPQAVWWIVVVVIGIFCMFAVVGSIPIMRMISILAFQPDRSVCLQSVDYWMKFQLIGFEFLNQGKWITSLVVVSSVLVSMGFI